MSRRLQHTCRLSDTSGPARRGVQPRSRPRFAGLGIRPDNHAAVAEETRAAGPGRGRRQGPGLAPVRDHRGRLAAEADRPWLAVVFGDVDGVADLAGVALPDVQAGRLGRLGHVPGVDLALDETGADAGVQRRVVLAVELGRGVDRGRCGQRRARRQKWGRGRCRDCAEPPTATDPGCPWPWSG